MAVHESKGSLRPLWLTLALFALIWIGWAGLLVLNPATLGADTLAASLVRNAVRLLVWGGAVWWFVRRVERQPLLAYLRLRGGGGWRLGLAALLALGWAAGAVLVKGDAVRWPTGSSALTTLLGAPLLEELLFRGLVLQKLAEHWPAWRATLVSALLFAAIHAPYWYLSGSQRGLALLGALVPIAALGCLFGLALRLTGSLWSAILLHIANNFSAGL